MAAPETTRQRPAVGNLVVPVFVILITGGLGIAVLLLYVAAEEDRLAVTVEAAVLQSVLSDEQHELADIAKDHAWWDETVLNVYVDYDEDWVEENLGEYLTQYFDINAVFAFDHAGELVVGGVDGRPWAIAEPPPIEAGLDRLLAAARDASGFEPEAVTGYLRIAGDLHVVAASAVVPDELPRATLPYDPGPVLVFSRRIDDAYLSATAIAFGIDDLRLAAPRDRGADDAADRAAELVLAGVDGLPLAELTWVPDQPGRELLRTATPWLLVLATLTLMPLAIFLRRSQRVAELLEANEQRFRDLANTDALTGCASRRYFLDLSRRALADARRYDQPLAVAMIDLDHFKGVNDAWGHDVGDELLRHFVRIARDNLRSTDFLGRLGGEEFAATLPHTDLATALEIAERLRRSFADAPLLVEGASHRATVSIGVAALAASDDSVHSLLKRADAALYDAKESGRDRVVAGG